MGNWEGILVEKVSETIIRIAFDCSRYAVADYVLENLDYYDIIIGDNDIEIDFSLSHIGLITINVNPLITSVDTVDAITNQIISDLDCDK